MDFGLQSTTQGVHQDAIHENEDTSDVEEDIEVVDSPDDHTDMGKDEFLELLVTQVQNQDPMDPMDNKEFMGEMAQFNSLQQMQSLNSTMEEFVGYQQLTQAGSLVGKEVSVINSETGETVTGQIDKIEMGEDSAEPMVIIDEEKHRMGNIQEVLAGE